MKRIWICNNTTNMNTHLFNFFFILCANIYKNIINLWRCLFCMIPNVNCWPAKHTFYYPFLGMNIYPLWWCYLMITATISNHIYKSVISNIINIPRNFVRVTFYNNFKLFIWIYYSYCSSVIISYKIINIRFYIFHPNFLTVRLITSWCSVV